MNVYIRPTGAPLGQTIGFAPNGSSASLDTAPVNASVGVADYVLVQSAGALVKVAAAAFAPSGAAVLVGAAGGGQSTATPVTALVNVVVTGAAGTGVVMPATPVGATIEVLNRCLVPILFYPPPGAQWENLAPNGPVTLQVGDGLRASLTSSTQGWLR